jgi:uncharacterized DUF497 family protein
MKVTQIVWLEEVIEKLDRKHGVSREEVLECLRKARYRFVEKGHRKGEDVYAAMAQTDAGRYLIVFLIYKKRGEALIVSARDMTESERRLYAKK